ncbi:MAG: hypothetical protein R2835_01360 [Thermomicrobiales bacterium]
MAPDDATDVIDELPADHAEQILIQMEPADAEEIRELLAYPSDSAGGIMTPASVSISPDLQASQAIAALQRVSEKPRRCITSMWSMNSSTFWSVLSLHRLVLTRKDTPVRELMVVDPVRVQATADRETAAACWSTTTCWRCR